MEGIKPPHPINYNRQARNPLLFSCCNFVLWYLSKVSDSWISEGKGIISLVTDFNFFHLIEVRYGDIDPQGHVNNAKFLTYMEQGRIFYLKQLKLWEGGSFLNLGVILADVQITFRKAIQFGDPIRVGVRISRIGNKSMTSEYRIEDARDASEFATGSSVLVAYDYHNKRSVPFPEEWRKAILKYEGLLEKSTR